MGQRYPLPITAAMLADANPNEAKPRYTSMTDWAGGAVGDDVSSASATVALANASGGAAAADYPLRNQAQKAASLGTSLAVDVGRPRGVLEPDDPYPVAGSPAAAAPVITSLVPNTAVAVTGAELVVSINGTGFTPWSTVTSGNYPIPSKYVSPTQLTIYQNPKASVAGVVQIVVVDHNVASAPSNFTFT